MQRSLVDAKRFLRSAVRDPHSFGPRDPVRQRRVAAFLPLPSAGTEHESEGELLGQCRRGIFLQ